MRACDYSVFVIRYVTSVHQRRDLGMDSEPTGIYKDVERDYVVVAPSEAFAITAFKRYHDKDIFKSIMCIGACDDIVRLQ